MWLMWLCVQCIGLCKVFKCCLSVVVVDVGSDNDTTTTTARAPGPGPHDAAMAMWGVGGVTTVYCLLQNTARNVGAAVVSDGAFVPCVPPNTVKKQPAKPGNVQAMQARYLRSVSSRCTGCQL